MSNKPLLIDHLDIPNAPNVNNKGSKSHNGSQIITVLASVMLVLLFISLLLIYRQLDQTCSAYNDTISCAFQQLLLYAPVLFLVGLFVAIVLGCVNYARTLGWFSYFEKNAHVNDANLKQELHELRLTLNADIAKTVAQSLRSAGWQTVSDDHSNTYKQTVQPESEINLTEDKNVMDESKLSPVEWLNNDNKG